MEAKDILLGMISLASAAVAGYAIYKLKETEKKIDDGVEKIAGAVGEVDISDTIIEEAVNKSVDKQVKVASAQAIVQVKHEILEEVRKSVKEAYGDTKDAVKKELESQIKDLDMDDIRKSVVNEASEKAQKKFDSDLDDILKKHSDKLDEVVKIYSGIENVLSQNRKGSSEGMTFKIGG